MTEKIHPSFDQHIAKKGEPGQLKSAREKYELAAKKLASTPADDKDYAAVREAKRATGIALSNTRQAEEQRYYGEEITENVRVITEMKAAQAANEKKVSV